MSGEVFGNARIDSAVLRILDISTVERPTNRGTLAALLGATTVGGNERIAEGTERDEPRRIVDGNTLTPGIEEDLFPFLTSKEDRHV
jgi:hypothetical protein